MSPILKNTGDVVPNIKNKNNINLFYVLLQEQSHIP